MLPHSHVTSTCVIDLLFHERHKISIRGTAMKLARFKEGSVEVCRGDPVRGQKSQHPYSYSIPYPPLVPYKVFLPRMAMRLIETVFLAIIGLCFLAEQVLAQEDAGKFTQNFHTKFLLQC